jgi:uncharacterized protein
LSAPGGYLDLLDHRRRTFALYDEVRRLAPKDPRAVHARWRSVRDELFATHPQSAIPAAARGDFRGLRYFPYDERFRFHARVEERGAGERSEVASSTGEPMWLREVGRVTLPIGTLPIFWIDVYGGGIFLPFRDATSGRETYGGGRYVLDTVKGADLGSTANGELIVDLNFAYNPSCHYDPRWSCPLAGPDSRLAARVEAGEMSWDGSGA